MADDLIQWIKSTGERAELGHRGPRKMRGSTPWPISCHPLYI